MCIHALIIVQEGSHRIWKTYIFNYIKDQRYPSLFNTIEK